MWVAPAVALLALALPDLDESAQDRLLALWMPALLALPPALVLLADAV